ncbi:MAG: NAD-dependent deacylase [Muribaculaceae bacterium]|nr:NAD-dependent deacylase [Muribaculaceae bacterium]
MKKLVVSSGAGISAESGMMTYRDAGGLWDKYPVMQVASAEGFAADPPLIHQFYSNMRQKMQANVHPNAAHLGLVDLERDFDVHIITQNADDLHERAGSSHVLHLHGELMKVRSMRHPERVYQLPCDQLTDKGLVTTVDTRDPYGDPVRPHIVFFGESVPEFEPAAELVQQADILVVIGTSLVVYPAAALIQYASSKAEIYYIDPNPASVPSRVHVIAKKATEGVAELTKLLRG